MKWIICFVLAIFFCFGCRSRLNVHEYGRIQISEIEEQVNFLYRLNKLSTTDEVEYIALNIKILDFINSVPIYQLDEYTTKILEILEGNHNQNFGNVLFDLGFRYNQLNSVHSLILFKRLRKVQSLIKQEEYNTKLPSLVLNKGRFYLFDKSKIEVLNHLLFSNLSQNFKNLAVYDKIDLLELSESISRLNPCNTNLDELNDKQLAIKNLLVDSGILENNNSKLIDNRANINFCEILNRVNQNNSRAGACIREAFDKYEMNNSDLKGEVNRLEQSMSCLYDEYISTQSPYVSKLNQLIEDTQVDIDEEHKTDVKRGQTKDTEIEDEDGNIIKTIREKRDRDGTLTIRVNDVKNKTYRITIVSADGKVIRTQINTSEGEYHSKISIDKDGNYIEQEAFIEKDGKTGWISKKEGGITSEAQFYIDTQTGEYKYIGYTYTGDNYENFTKIGEGNVGGPVKALRDRVPNIITPDPDKANYGCAPRAFADVDLYGKNLGPYIMPNPNDNENYAKAQELLDDLSQCLRSPQYFETIECDYLERCFKNGLETCDCGNTNYSSSIIDRFNCGNLIECPIDSYFNPSTCNCESGPRTNTGLLGNRMMNLSNIKIDSLSNVRNQIFERVLGSN
ncbi:hypothetical protein HME9304_01833 [Flagellimonas maritima]|uniref:Uncharacterized protein n=1 Tax=Flagellimonas maritima TaxID=1383885 RepID=A0A2Z4LTY4_9FLAO|nr:hypothetical protein [Allomuricauda aurantiaca]AWX44828.1 hypothetical protein HME9304_01833 [Allomuricauda aurantiaca]